MSGLVDNDEEVHGGNGVAVGGIASTREDLGGGTYVCMYVLCALGCFINQNTKTKDTQDDPPG